jgi:hypothetical protein
MTIMLTARSRRMNTCYDIRLRILKEVVALIKKYGK